MISKAKIVSSREINNTPEKLFGLTSSLNSNPSIDIINDVIASLFQYSKYIKLDELLLRERFPKVLYDKNVGVPDYCIWHKCFF